MLSDTCSHAAEGGRSDNKWADNDDVLWTLLFTLKDFADEDENDIDEDVHLKPSSCSNKGTDGIY